MLMNLGIKNGPAAAVAYDDTLFRRCLAFHFTFERRKGGDISPVVGSYTTILDMPDFTMMQFSSTLLCCRIQFCRGFTMPSCMI